LRIPLFAASAAAVVLLLSACGGGSDKPASTATSTTPNGDSPATVAPGTPANEQPQVPDQPIPTPTRLPDDVAVIQVAFGGKVYAPLRSEFGGLDKSTVTVNGKNYQGVSLATLAAHAGAKADGVATIQGTRADNLRLGAIRFSLSDIGATTVFVTDEGGRLDLASSSIPAEQWLNDVTSVSVN
jgi:hypothetical protein